MRELNEVLPTDREAVDGLVARARAVPVDAWSRPTVPGKWSPGQVVEHVVVSYEMARQALLGKPSMPAIPRILRPVVRKLFLGKVIRTGKFPKGAKAPASLMPAASPGDRDVLIGRLRTESEAFRRTALEHSGHGEGTLDHPVFGRLSVPDYVMVLARHTTHHAKQIPGAAPLA
jgi:hypothetical protein